MERVQLNQPFRSGESPPCRNNRTDRRRIISWKHSVISVPVPFPRDKIPSNGFHSRRVSGWLYNARFNSFTRRAGEHERFPVGHCRPRRKSANSTCATDQIRAVRVNRYRQLESETAPTERTRIGIGLFNVNIESRIGMEKHIERCIF